MQLLKKFLNYIRKQLESSRTNGLDPRVALFLYFDTDDFKEIAYMGDFKREIGCESKRLPVYDIAFNMSELDRLTSEYDMVRFEDSKYEIYHFEKRGYIFRVWFFNHLECTRYEGRKYLNDSREEFQLMDYSIIHGENEYLKEAASDLLFKLKSNNLKFNVFSLSSFVDKGLP
tara:strand:- start:124323 stop:124841 length:519 start_codon:yes stop_codon:yes gene_type:complete